MNDYGLGSTASDTTKIPHYYGNYVRMIFIAAAVLSAFSIPIWGDVLPIGTMPQIIGIVILVVLAGLTNPHGTTVLWVNAIVAGLGIILIENAAITLYSIDEVPIFLAREIIVLLLLVAMYFSIKTVRAMATHQIGHTMDVGEFDTPEEEKQDDE
ncbi:hypothetical protein FJY93_03095 [Candidatus Kaiserbacteria bacterium]|nr:hypothetical protein [Candidatus Kaiserbacteria bacterium]